MSVHVMSWVLRNSEARLGQRLVLLVLADHASDDGTGAWPSVGTIAREARMSESQTRECLRKLERSDSIIATGKSRQGTVVYSVLMGGTDIRGGTKATQGGAQIASQGGAESGPEPSLEQPSKSNRPKTPVPGKVDGKATTDDERLLAWAILSEWNEHANQSLRSADWLRKIIMRIRERPELRFAEHAHIIRYALDHPWWRGDPSPSVVYGNGALFEQHLTQAAKGDTSGAQGAFQVALAAINEARGQA